LWESNDILYAFVLLGLLVYIWAEELLYRGPFNSTNQSEINIFAFSYFVAVFSYSARQLELWPPKPRHNQGNILDLIIANNDDNTV